MACRQCVDDVSMVRTTYAHMQMTCRQCADDTCRRCVDNVHMITGAVLHEIRQLRQEQLCIKPKMASLLLLWPVSCVSLISLIEI